MNCTTQSLYRSRNAANFRNHANCSKLQGPLVCSVPAIAASRLVISAGIEAPASLEFGVRCLLRHLS
ncbi:hypothetical protein ACU8KH_00255 [Lachancea thermotolerans]